jgi:hypothetical protein
MAAGEKTLCIMQLTASVCTGWATNGSAHKKSDKRPWIARFLPAGFR